MAGSIVIWIKSAAYWHAYASEGGAAGGSFRVRHCLGGLKLESIAAFWT
jgi:hypothetical protein